MSSDPSSPFNPYLTPNSPGAAMTMPMPEVRPKESGWGIASFVLSILAGGGTFVAVVVAGVLTASRGGAMEETSAAAMVLGLVMLGCVGLCGLGVVFGIVGLVQPRRSRIFAMLGLVFNLLVVLGFVGLMAIGLTMGRAASQDANWAGTVPGLASYADAMHG